MADINSQTIYKYGYGLLKLDSLSLHSMSIDEFLERVEGALLWTEARLDAELNQQAVFFAHLISMQGKMLKKGTTIDEIKQSLYMSLSDIETENQKSISTEFDAETEREKLKARFSLDK